MKTSTYLLISIIIVSIFIGHSQAKITLDWVTVGNPSSTNDDTGYGIVSEIYRTSKYEITAGQYTEFLNAVAATDTYSLYNTSMCSKTA